MAVIYGDDLANDLSGTAGADTIYGLGGDDTLRSQSGDALYGGGGNDVYYVESNPDLLHSIANVREDANQGHDSVYWSASGATKALIYHLPQNVEDLYVSGSVVDIVYGNDGDNLIDVSGVYDVPGSYVSSVKGGLGDDVIFGGDSFDTLDGGEGVDGMAGGKGDDEYFVDNVNDIVVENSGGGRDYVFSTANSYKLASNVEDMYLAGDGRQVLAYGNTLGNDIRSEGDYSRVINAGRGNDYVESYGNATDVYNGGAGNDTLKAGLGDDVYRTSGAFGRDEITDAGGDDAVEFDVNESTLWFSKSGNDLSVSVIGTQNGVTIKNWYSDATAKIEEFYAGTGKMLTAAKVDTLVSAMSAFAQPTTAALPANIQTALAPTLAAAWQ